jgi:hypothetical protein
MLKVVVVDVFVNGMEIIVGSFVHVMLVFMTVSLINQMHANNFQPLHTTTTFTCCPIFEPLIYCRIRLKFQAASIVML